MATSVPDLIAKKREGGQLSSEEMHHFVQGVVNGNVAECQIGAMLMAMFLKGLTSEEVVTMTLEMKNSGTSLHWPEECQGHLVDKHSTGGVGDKISLVLAPALAACGLKVPMISGRGLGHTGGTLDKLEAIPGFNVSLTSEEMSKLLTSTGCFIAGQTGNICPADKKLYATRDVTSTVAHQGLAIGSIISKKAAENINSLVLDVKAGSGAFMQTIEEASDLAEAMVKCSNGIGINTVALLTLMDSPIGNMVGNALEVAESIWCLQGSGPSDVMDLVIELGAHLLKAHGNVPSAEDGKKKLNDVINDGSALAKFKAMAEGQGCSPQVIDDLCDPTKDIWKVLPAAAFKTNLKCSANGYVKEVNAMGVARAGHKLGGGRNSPGDAIDMAVGLELLVDIGSKVEEGQSWIRVHHSQAAIPQEVLAHLTNALVISDVQVPQRTTRLLRVVH